MCTRLRFLATMLLLCGLGLLVSTSVRAAPPPPPKYWSRAHGSPASEGVSVFFVAGGKLVFLRRADMPTVTTVNHGPIIAMQLPSYGRPTADVY